MNGCGSEARGDDADESQVVEFEAEARTTAIETWRVVLAGAGDLDDEQVADRLEAELAAGNARFVARIADEDLSRVVRRESLLRL